MNMRERRRNMMKFALDEKGQGMVEYALILVLVAVVVIAAVTIMGPLVGKVFSTINRSL
jgi:pilus assembly protein Flp/PilA